jgi:hypothetical protein
MCVGARRGDNVVKAVESLQGPIGMEAIYCLRNAGQGFGGVISVDGKNRTNISCAEKLGLVAKKPLKRLVFSFELPHPAKAGC